MARNIEIKARVADPASIRQKAQALARHPAEVIGQTDTFFVVPTGRLKVREFGDGSGELISYQRPDQPGPKESTYTRVPCESARDLLHALGSVLPVRGYVIKQREVFLVGRTRLHLDTVENLGSFVELEVVMQEHEHALAGEREARELMEALGISAAALVREAYIDLVEDSAHKNQ